ncbi:hypothetical protein [Lactobacillus taiwanensis]|jgi:hypothetical protein|nr:hypothetical protein [Lactobacillus taiwanensis]
MKELNLDVEKFDLADNLEVILEANGVTSTGCCNGPSKLQG